MRAVHGRQGVARLGGAADAVKVWEQAALRRQAHRDAVARSVVLRQQVATAVGVAVIGAVCFGVVPFVGLEMSSWFQ